MSEMSMARALLAACIGSVLFSAGAGRPFNISPTSIPHFTAREPDATKLIHSEVDVAGSRRAIEDEAGGACWNPRGAADSPACLCSTGMVERFLTPDSMRSFLVAWHHSGELTNSELLERLQQVDAACGLEEAAP